MVYSGQTDRISEGQVLMFGQVDRLIILHENSTSVLRFLFSNDSVFEAFYYNNTLLYFSQYETCSDLRYLPSIIHSIHSNDISHIKNVFLRP